MNALPKHHSFYQSYLDLMQVAEEMDDVDLREFAREINADRFQSAWVSVYDLVEADADRLCGVELHNEKIDQWASILVDPSDPSMFRAQYYARNGFHGHACHYTAEQVLDELIREGFTQLDIGAMARLSGKPEWHYGSEVAAIIQKVNGGLISYREGEMALDRAKAHYQVA